MADGGVPPGGEAIAGAGPQIVVEAEHHISVIHHGTEFAFIERVRTVLHQTAAERIEIVAALRSDPVALAEQADVQGVDVGIEEGLEQSIVFANCGIGASRTWARWRLS